METPTTGELAEKDSFAVLPGTPESTPHGNTDFHQPHPKFHTEIRLVFQAIITCAAPSKNWPNANDAITSFVRIWSRSVLINNFL